MANSNQPVLTPHELAALDLVIAQGQLEEFQANETDAPPPQVATGPRPTGLTAVTLSGLGAATIGLTVLVVVTAAAVTKTEASQIKLRRQITDAFAEFARENGVNEPSLDELIALRQRLLS